MSQKAAESKEIAKEIVSVKKWRLSLKEKTPRATIGFVPTMGALHKGHEKLIEAASSQCDHVMVSIFVNPTQFGPGEDLDKYPRTLENDLDVCRKHGVELVFIPNVSELYGSDFDETTFVNPPQRLVDRLCGLSRPGHFRGVATVVAKLFNIAQADRAYFGEKDYQQLLVVKNLVSDLKIETEIIGVPIVRDDDGLALSSRNVYLSKDERIKAPELRKALLNLEKSLVEDNISIEEAKNSAVAKLEKEFGFEVQYLEVCHPQTLEFLTKLEPSFVILIAAKLGEVRLIDNHIVG